MDINALRLLRKIVKYKSRWQFSCYFQVEIKHIIYNLCLVMEITLTHTYIIIRHRRSHWHGEQTHTTSLLHPQDHTVCDTSELNEPMNRRLETLCRKLCHMSVENYLLFYSFITIILISTNVTKFSTRVSIRVIIMKMIIMLCPCTILFTVLLNLQVLIVSLEPVVWRCFGLERGWVGEGRGLNEGTKNHEVLNNYPMSLICSFVTVG